MPKVHRTHHTRLDSLSVAPYDVKTLFGIDIGPLEMVLHFFSPDFCGVKIGPAWKASPVVKIPLGNCLMGQNTSSSMEKAFIRAFFALSRHLGRSAGACKLLFLCNEMVTGRIFV